ncbi:MAG: DUF1573 domain-containing protein [Bacteroidetes bacterium]|nr:DUF1573 domain-containing protein [Bacteroidota bacterium]
MRKIALLIFILFAVTTTNAQSDVHKQNAGSVSAPITDVLKLKEPEFDFGKIPQGKPVYHNFEIVNIGKTALALDNVQASCGCTTPEWNKEPIAPGATATIKVGYNAAVENVFEKYITITYNGNQTKQLIIKGNVWKAPAGSAPANASIDLLKKQTF